MAKASRKKTARKVTSKTAKSPAKTAKAAKLARKKAARKPVRATPAHVKHVNALAKANPAFARLVAKYGMPKPTVKQAHIASAASADEICMETDCVDGKKIVMRRNAAGDCTKFSEESC